MSDRFKMDSVDAYWDFVWKKEEEWDHCLDKIKSWWLPWMLKQFMDTRESMRPAIRSYRMNELRGNFQAANYWRSKIIDMYSKYMDRVERTALTNVMQTLNTVFDKQRQEFRDRNYKITECYHLLGRPTESYARMIISLWADEVKVDGNKPMGLPENLFAYFDKVERPPEPPKVLSTTPSSKKPRIIH